MTDQLQNKAIIRKAMLQQGAAQGAIAHNQPLAKVKFGQKTTQDSWKNDDFPKIVIDDICGIEVW
ncbi:MAG: hypothetical protein KME49_00030 [Brasilonema octagenarum HA4186-MV1]|uniref:hypothetical protein n=2 Tax=Scytonemataceae TaxID=1182 RepID=UPI00145EDDDA|nr:hypothetical protein [Brasilonema octagenarum HA4186-MV1]QDL16231.1 hypothetical protein DP113_20040 [Brasilonema octagenarum UFV-E1]